MIIEKNRPGWQYYEKLEDVFSIEYKDTVGTMNPTLHKHDQYELLLCFSDEMFLKVDKNKYNIGKNTLLIFNSMDLHHFGTNKIGAPNKRYVIFFDPSYINFLSCGKINLLDCFLFRPFPDSWILQLTQEEAETLQNHLDKIILLQKKSEEEFYGKELYLQLLLAEILLYVNTIYRNTHHINNIVNVDEHDRVYEIINFIHKNYEEELTLDLLSQHFFINKYSLCEMFREVAGTTPNQYIINCRIAKAKELLMNGYSVEDTCGKSGFNNLSHFSRTFKNKVGMSPKKYQQSANHIHK